MRALIVLSPCEAVVLVSNPVPSRTRRSFRWLGAGLLTAAIAYLLTLGTLRERFSTVPDLAWFVLLTALLASTGAIAARELPAVAGRRQRVRRRLLGSAAVVLGGMGVSAGVLSVSTWADTWNDGERTVGALMFCVALAVFPFGIVLLRRGARGEAHSGSWQSLEARHFTRE
jgi:hypothetical protein